MNTLWIAGAIAGGLALFLLAAWAFQALWNWIIPSKFNGPSLAFKHAAGILLISRLLFGGLGWGHGPRHGDYRHAFHDGGKNCRFERHSKQNHGRVAPLSGDTTITNQ